jgi:beta-lactamase regulating signal transducer with metallopeptidase domain
MNEVLITFLIIIISSFIFFNISLGLIRKFKINHPKDKYRIYSMVMISIFLISLLSITVISNSLQNPSYLDRTYINNQEDSCSLVVLIDERQVENNNILNSIDSINHNCETEQCNHDNCDFSDLCNPKILSLFVTSSNNIHNIVNNLKIELSNPSFDIDTGITINEKTDHEELNFSFLFLIFNVILIILSIAYLFYSFIFNKKIILKDVNANRCNDLKVLQMVKKVCREIKIKTPKVYVFNGYPNAFVFGHPAYLVISKKLINYLSEDELRTVLYHELAHISNKDNILKPILQTMRIMFFYNPIVHILYYKIINERELLADSKFINSKEEKIRFMEILFKVNDFSKNYNLFSRKIYTTSLLLLVSHKIKKLEISDRFNNLFTYRSKKTFFTTIICLIVLFANISIISLAQNTFLNHLVDSNEELVSNMCNNDLDNCCSINNVNTIYILRLIKLKSDLYDVIVIEDTLND